MKSENLWLFRLPGGVVRVINLNRLWFCVAFIVCGLGISVPLCGKQFWSEREKRALVVFSGI